MMTRRPLLIRVGSAPQSIDGTHWLSRGEGVFDDAHFQKAVKGSILLLLLLVSSKKGRFAKSP
jgi:hypothetical protein